MPVRVFDVVIERDEEGWYVADVPALPGCHTQAKTKKELLANVREAIALCLDMAKERKTKASTGFVGIERVEVNA